MEGNQNLGLGTGHTVAASLLTALGFVVALASRDAIKTSIHELDVPGLNTNVKKAWVYWAICLLLFLVLTPALKALKNLVEKRVSTETKRR